MIMFFQWSGSFAAAHRIKYVAWVGDWWIIIELRACALTGRGARRRLIFCLVCWVGTQDCVAWLARLTIKMNYCTYKIRIFRNAAAAVQKLTTGDRWLARTQQPNKRKTAAQLYRTVCQSASVCFVGTLFENDDLIKGVWKCCLRLGVFLVRTNGTHDNQELNTAKSLARSWCAARRPFYCIRRPRRRLASVLAARQRIMWQTGALSALRVVRDQPSATTM